MYAMPSAFAALPIVPGTNAVARYEMPGHKRFSREWGDDLLSALDGGRQLREWQPNHRIGIGAIYTVGTNIIYTLPVPSHDWLNIALTNGGSYRLGIGDGFVDLPESRYEVKDDARNKINKLTSQLAENLRKEILNGPKPLVYIVGTIDDGGTLSGIAHLFYGNSGKWRKIYEANRHTIKNPDVITRGLNLTIPK